MVTEVVRSLSPPRPPQRIASLTARDVAISRWA